MKFRHYRLAACLPWPWTGAVIAALAASASLTSVASAQEPSGETAAGALDAATCLACHGDPSGSRPVDEAAFRASVHGSLDCTSCHTDVAAIPHDVPLNAVRWQQVPTTCGQCHADVLETFTRSIHGQAIAAGKREAPVCTDCHGVHTIAHVRDAASGVFPTRIPETCGQCHAAERITTRYRLPSYVVETYMGSFHGLAVQLGSVTAAHCASCHGAHSILPSSDSRSSIHPDNLPKTCGQCHAGATVQVTRGWIHTGAQPGLEHWAVAVVRRIYLVLIPVILGSMLVHNALDLRRKLLAHYREQLRLVGPVRMALNERLQHGLLIVTFVTLAYTGFALKFPTAWWANPFVGRMDWRSGGHRAAALLFVLLALYHVVFMLATPRGRRELRDLWPRRWDLVQLRQQMAYALGRRADRPIFGRYSYIEKLEYWTLVWGSIIMATTGALMTWNSWTLRLFPKWFFDVVTAIHFYEAVLACLAILIWHGYFVAFDPEEYPMKWTWLTGKASVADQRHRAPDERADQPPPGTPTG